MKQQDSQIGIIVTLVSVSSVACGALLCLALWVLAGALGCVFSSGMYFYAYVTGSVGFLLTAPVSIFKPLQNKYGETVPKLIMTWSVTTIAIFLLACAVGVIFMLAIKLMSDSPSPMALAGDFLSGVFILFVSSGIHWIAYRRKQRV